MKHFRAKPLRPVSGRPVFLVDHLGVRIADPQDNIIGFANSADRTQIYPPANLGGERLVFALATNVTGGNLSLRYRPPKDPAEVCLFGMDFSNVIPAGVGIAAGELAIATNTVPPVDATDQWYVSPVVVRGRALYANLGVGIAGTDYILTFTATDTGGNVWPRSALCLVAATS